MRPFYWGKLPSGIALGAPPLPLKVLCEPFSSSRNSHKSHKPEVPEGKQDIYPDIKLNENTFPNGRMVIVLIPMIPSKGNPTDQVIQKIWPKKVTPKGQKGDPP